MDYKERYQSWIESDFFDEETIEELKALTDESEIEDRFYKELEFGTAGLRGKIAAGSNRMNVYTVARATQGLANTIVEFGEDAKKRGVAIAYDVRNKSDDFSKVAASILAANGIKVYIYPDIRPTPMLSFAVRHLKTISGIVITASHNPKDYNGYKVYWEQGSQILDEIAHKILSHIDKIAYDEVVTGDFNSLVASGDIEMISSEVDEAYYSNVLSRALNDDVDRDVCVVYSPLNGTGNLPVRHVLDVRGFTNINVVAEQENPDGNFTTVGYPNPEDVRAFEYAQKLGEELSADLLLATDPDCDRVAMMARDETGRFVAFNGNQTGVLLVKYILESLSEKDMIPQNGAIVKSIVTGNMIAPICEKYGVKLFETLTGFKNICALPNEWDTSGEYNFIFGYEESIGYTYGNYVRDKDAVISSMLIVEMAGYYKKRGKTLVDVLYDAYEEYGYYREKLVSLVLEGVEGQERIKRMMEEIRKAPITEIGDMKCEKVIDYLNDDTGVGKSNVLKYNLSGGSWYVVRPSGTEPKIKLYVYSRADDLTSSEDRVKLIEKTVLERLHSVK